MKYCGVLFFLLLCLELAAQNRQQPAIPLPENYASQLTRKTTQYAQKAGSATRKTLEKLARWEGRLQKILPPAIREKLFSPNQLTFSSLLKKMEEGEARVQQYQNRVNDYRQELDMQVKYLSGTGYAETLRETRNQLQKLDSVLSDTEATSEFIRERKKQLLHEASAYLLNSRWFKKMNREAGRYTEALQRYQAVFSQPDAAEALALEWLSRLPAFQQFIQQISGAANTGGLQTRSSVAASLAQQNGNIAGSFSNRLQQAAGRLNSLKQQWMPAGNGEGEQAAANNTGKRLFKKIQYHTDIQWVKGGTALPARSDISLGASYPFRKNAALGIGLNYKLGWGSLQRTRFTHAGAGFRSFGEWKIKGGFWLHGSYEKNFLPYLQTVAVPTWQNSALLGLSRKVNFRSKWIKAGNILLLYDFLYRQKPQLSQPLQIRIGYQF